MRMAIRKVSNIELWLALSDLVSEKVDNNEIDFELNHHFGSDKIMMDYLKKQINVSIFDIVKSKDMKTLIEVMSSKHQPDKWIPLRKSILCRCSNCGDAVQFMFNGKTLKIEDECPFKGNVSYEFELNVPSGKMVVANDLRQYFRVIGHYDVNTAKGCMLTSQKYAEVGMAHAMVGNTCPGVYKLANDKFAIGYRVKGRKVGSVCTDLWWYSIADFDEYHKRKCDVDHNVVKCKPGVYKFKHLYHNVERDASGSVYTQIDWVRDPDPIKNYSSDYDSLNLTAGQVVKEALKWNIHTHDIEGRKRPLKEAIMFAADHILCVGGNGYEYHKNGFLSVSPDLNNDSPSIKIPLFDREHGWYPLYKDSFLVRASGNGEEPYWHDGLTPKDLILNKSFVALAFNVLHCIVKYGVIKQLVHDQSESTVEYANLALKGFMNKYPNQIPGYVKSYFNDK